MTRRLTNTVCKKKKSKRKPITRKEREAMLELIRQKHVYSDRRLCSDIIGTLINNTVPPVFVYSCADAATSNQQSALQKIVYGCHYTAETFALVNTLLARLDVRERKLPDYSKITRDVSRDAPIISPIIKPIDRELMTSRMLKNNGLEWTLNILSIECQKMTDINEIKSMILSTLALVKYEDKMKGENNGKISTEN
jgi:hypothetical protein